MDAENIKQRIVRMKESGRSARQIAQTLNESGIKTPKGKKWDSQKIFDIVYADKKKTGTTRAYVRKAKELLNPVEDLEQVSTDVNVLAILCSTKYTDTQKVQAIKALLT